jgi:ATP-dependent Lon protease
LISGVSDTMQAMGGEGKLRLVNPQASLKTNTNRPFLSETGEGPGTLLALTGCPVKIVIMLMPREVPVMILPNATLFPQALLPLYIFEPRYRRMLADCLDSHRMLCVAMQRPGSTRETPAPVAGLGVVRVSVQHKDATSHLILQGLARVHLRETVCYKPYRQNRIELLNAPPCNTVALDALICKLKDLLEERVELGLPFPFPVAPAPDAGAAQVSGTPAAEVLKYLAAINDPEQLTDLVSCAVLPDARERQAILETVEVDIRLRRLIHFLLADLRRHDRNSGNE